MPSKTAKIRPSNAIRTLEMVTAGRTSHLRFQPGQKMPTIHASSGFIRGIPVKLFRAWMGASHGSKPRGASS
jgi:hypothetical protein